MSKEKQGKIRKVFKLLGYQNFIDEVAQGCEEEYKEEEGRGLSEAEKQVINFFREKVFTELIEPFEKVFDNHFSEEDLDKIISAYSKPVFKRLLKAYEEYDAEKKEVYKTRLIPWFLKIGDSLPDSDECAEA